MLVELSWGDVCKGNTVLVGDSRGEVLLITPEAVRIQWEHLDSPRNYSKAMTENFGFVFTVTV
jgi:hypothetical protein